MPRTDVRRERVNKGLCPECGEEAAPYRLCHRHRLTGVIRRCLNAGRKTGAVAAVRDDKDKRKLLFSKNDSTAPWNFRSAYDGGDRDENDKRTRPRLGRIAVDVERELMEIMRRIGRPATEDEIVAAWGRLRSERKHATAAGDMAAIIAAEHKRQARNQKRLAQTGVLAEPR